MVYADDILILWENEQNAKWLVDKIREKFESITEETSDAFILLGMYLDIDKKGRYLIDMQEHVENAVNKHLGDITFTKISFVPGGKDPF